jgi:hypothetical protein
LQENSLQEASLQKVGLQAMSVVPAAQRLQEVSLQDTVCKCMSKLPSMQMPPEHGISTGTENKQQGVSTASWLMSASVVQDRGSYMSTAYSIGWVFSA